MQLIEKMQTARPQSIYAFVVLFVFLMANTTSAQQKGYQYVYTESDLPYETTACIEDNNKGFFIAACDRRIPTTSHLEGVPSLIIKLSEIGEELGVAALSELGVYSYITDLYADPSNSNQYYAIGKIYDTIDQREKPFLVSFDNNLNILQQHIIDLPERCRYILYASTIMSDDQKFYYVSSCRPDFDEFASRSPQLYLRISTNGEVEGMTLDTVNVSSLYHSGDIFPYQDGSGDFGHFYVTVNELGLAKKILVRCTPQLELTQEYLEEEGYPLVTEVIGNEIYAVHSAHRGILSTKMLPDSKLLYSEDATEYIYNRQQDWYFHNCAFVGKMNLETFETTQYQIVGRENDSTEALSELQGVDFINPNEVFHCVYVRSGGDYLFAYEPLTIVVTKMDEMQNITWQRHFFFDGMHHPSGIKAASDGGCWVYGCIFEELGTWNQNSKAFVMRINADGTLDIPNLESFYFIAPNPATDFLTIGGEDLRSVELYNTLGQRVMQISVEGTSLAIDISSLPLGLYLVSITDSGGKQYVRKVVKK